MQGLTTHELITIDPKARAEFFEFYDFLIAEAKRHGLIKTAVIHARNRKRIWDDVTLLD